jgi:nucleotide-binding universal stress UspA family protein
VEKSVKMKQIFVYIRLLNRNKPFTMKNLIVPIDFSKESLNGLELALLFTKKQYTNIQMVYVQKKSSDYNSPGYFAEEKQYADKKFKEILAKYQPKLKNDSKLRYIIKSGTIYKEIVNQVESYNEAMVVASTHGGSGFEELFLGSNAYKIISATNRPVLTIRKNKCPADIRKIVLPIDITVDSRQKVPFTADLAELFGAEIHIVMVSSSQSKKLKQRLSAYGHQVEKYIKSRQIPFKLKSLYGENIIDLIVVYTDSVDADLISIMKEQPKSFNFLGNFTQQILNRAATPVLTISSKETRIATGFRTSGD